MPTTSNPDLRFIFTVDQVDRYERFKAHVVYMVDPDPTSYNPNDSGVRNPCAWDAAPLAALSDLTIVAQRSADEDWYAWRLCYDRPHEVELDDAERMVKFLRSVTKRLARLDERYGSPDTLAAFCARVADVIGCQRSHVWGTYYPEVRANGTHYQFTDVDGLRSRLARVRADV